MSSDGSSGIELTQGSSVVSRLPRSSGLTLSRWPLSASRIIRFQKQSHFWRPHWFLPGNRPLFRKGSEDVLALVSEANIAGKTIVTYNLHLESRGDDQLRRFQLEEVLADARRYNSNTPILLTGDFNPRCIRWTCSCRNLTALGFKTRLREPTRSDDTWPILGARADYRLGLYARNRTCRPSPGQSFGFSFQTIIRSPSSYRRLVSTGVPISVHRSESACWRLWACNLVTTSTLSSNARHG